ncbi:MAG: methionine--tRNA ligase [Verrucomicrobiales bacterium]
MKPFFLTTAIDYPNAAPHLGHAYEKVLADAIARHVRRTGRPVYFLTGLDQHGQKVQQTAEKAGISPALHVQQTSKLFAQLWGSLGISHDAWIETTDERHKSVVRSLLQRLYDAGEITKGLYRGYYSVRQEQYITAKERREDGTFGPEWGEVVELEEENWYFHLKNHLPWLRQFLSSHPETVFPESRLRNLVQAVEDTAGADLCISRPKSRLRWGIELPFDPDFVCYVWFDALTNYLSGAGWLDGSWDDGGPGFAELWPNDCNVIGKDILVPAHGIYWLTMLHAAGFADEQMPRFLVHGWWNIRNQAGESEKMSKSLGNVVDPQALVDSLGPDPLRYYLLSEIATGQDADFSNDRLIVRNNTELANGLGNLLNRALNMSHRYCGGIVTRGPYDDPLLAELRETVTNLPNHYLAALETWQFNRGLEAVWTVIDAANRFIERTEPFKLAKDPTQAERVTGIMHHLCETLAHVSVFLEPVIPQAMAGLRAQLGWEPNPAFTYRELLWGIIPDGHALGKASPLFPRIEPPANAP